MPFNLVRLHLLLHSRRGAHCASHIASTINQCMSVSVIKHEFILYDTGVGYGINLCVFHMITWLNVDLIRAPPSLYFWTHWALSLWQPKKKKNCYWFERMFFLFAFFVCCCRKHWIFWLFICMTDLVCSSKASPGLVRPSVVVLSFCHLHVITEPDENFGLPQFLDCWPLTQLHKHRKRNSQE